MEILLNLPMQRLTLVMLALLHALHVSPQHHSALPVLLANFSIRIVAMPLVRLAHFNKMQLTVLVVT